LKRLVHNVWKCNLFQEIFQVEAIAENRGVIIKATPKYHCELAGEGIEYSWGFAKLRLGESTSGGQAFGSEI